MDHVDTAGGNPGVDYLIMDTTLLVTNAPGATTSTATKDTADVWLITATYPTQGWRVHDNLGLIIKSPKLKSMLCILHIQTCIIVI